MPKHKNELTEDTTDKCLEEYRDVMEVLKDVQSKVYEICPIYGDKYVVAIRKVFNAEYDELTVDDENNCYAIKRIQGRAEPTGVDDFDSYLAFAERLGYQQAPRNELSDNGYVVKMELLVTDAELEVLLWCVKQGVLSIAAIQRQFNLTFRQAATLFDWMEQKKYIDSSANAEGKHKVTLTEEQFNAIYKRN